MWNIRDVRSMKTYASTAEERTLTDARSWLAGHSGQHVRLSIKDVREITFRLIDAGIEPSVQAIRTVNGGHGSIRVIHVGIHDFFKRMDYGRRWDWQSARQDPSESLRAVRKVTHRYLVRRDGIAFTTRTGRRDDAPWNR